MLYPRQAVVADFTAMMVVLGFTLSMIESVVLMVSVGLMLDPLTHVAHAFTEARGSSAERLDSALTSIGISVLSGALSTAASCTFLFFTTIVLFTSFGLLLCALTLICLLHANFFLAPLLFLFGPGSSCGGRHAVGATA